MFSTRMPVFVKEYQLENKRTKLGNKTREIYTYKVTVPLFSAPLLIL